MFRATRTGSRPCFPSFSVVVPLYSNPLKTKQGTLFIPRLLPGLDFFLRGFDGYYSEVQGAS